MWDFPGGPGSIPGRGNKIPHAARRSLKIKKKKDGNIRMFVVCVRT